MPSDRAVTLQDIADRLGVTRSTVSYAITGRGRVSQDTKQKVLAAARDLGYQPNTLARRLRGSQTGILALRLPRYTSKMSYYMEATFGVAEEAEQAGMIVSLLTTEVRPADLQRLHADGVILLDPDADDPAARALLSGPIPVVTGELVPPGLSPGQGAVSSDHATAVVELLDHLAERGAHRPALIIPDMRWYWAMSVRAAFETWCQERGIAARVSTIPHPATARHVTSRVANLLAGGAQAADAIVAGSDGIVLNVVTSAELGGRRVGEDLLVATVVDSEILTLTRPPITALDLHPREFGRRCVRTLLAVLGSVGSDDPGGSRHDVVPIDLRRRESTLGLSTPGAAPHQGG